jgi:hypothetical protein
LWEIPRMETVKADDRQRVRLPNVKPGQVFVLMDNGNDTITLTKVKAEAKEPFPPGSLRNLVNDMNREWAGVQLSVPEPEERD